MIYFDKDFFFNNELFVIEEVNSGYNKYYFQRILQCVCL